MEGQMKFEDWMPEACPGTEEFEKTKNAEVEKKPAKGRKKTIAENAGAVVKEPQNDYVAENRENWYALLVAIIRDDIHSADDAILAMGIKRTYNNSEQESDDDSYWENLHLRMEAY